MFAITKFRCIEVLFSYILQLLGRRISFVIPKTLLYSGALSQGSTVLDLKHAFYKTIFFSY